MFSLKPFLAAATLIIVLAACSGNKKQAPEIVTDPSIPGNFSTQTIRVFDSASVHQFLDSFPLLTPIAPDLEQFYKTRNYAYAWFDKNGMIEQAGNLFNKIKNIGDEGIDLTRLPYQKVMNSLMENHAINTTDSMALATELMLTSQYLLYARNVWNGLAEQSSIDQEWLLPRKKLLYTQLLDSLLTGKDLLENAPVYKQYYLLKQFLQAYRQAEPGDTLLINASANKYALGDSGSTIGQIKNKLVLLGDLPNNTTGEQFDSAMLTAVANFQERVGLRKTGKIAVSEIKALNVPLHDRIETILVNMERCRWVSADLKNNFLFVNIPEYKLYVYEQDSIAWDMNVVVGRDQSKTVVFNGTIKYIVFSPYWYLPQSIIKNETLPAIKRNKNYLANHDMEWNEGKIRQKPGPNNALGQVKFLFPNSHSIYLHDSPAKSLFRETNRAFSHGCIRLAEPEKLAAYLLRNDTSWTKEKIEKAMTAEKELYVSLREPEPVFIAYFTAWVDAKGKLNFRDDIYKRDSRLLDMLLK